MTTALPEQDSATPAATGQKKAFGGLFVRKQCWTLSFTAKIIILAVLAGMAWGGIRFVHPFLAITKPASAELLVVEAWIPRYGLHESVSIFQKGGYKRMITSGCARLNDLDGRTASNPAEAAAIQVQRYGMNPALVTAVPCPIELKDRTYNTALAVKEWCEKSGMSPKSIDVATMGPHARRSRLLFQAAFGNETKIGVIAIKDISYDSDHWWRTSEGVRDVIGEGIAYVYARVFFHPSAAAQEFSGSGQSAPIPASFHMADLNGPRTKNSYGADEGRLDTTNAPANSK